MRNFSKQNRFVVYYRIYACQQRFLFFWSNRSYFHVKFDVDFIDDKIVDWDQADERDGKRQRKRFDGLRAQRSGFRLNERSRQGHFNHYRFVNVVFIFAEAVFQQRPVWPPTITTFAFEAATNGAVIKDSILS